MKTSLLRNAFIALALSFSAVSPAFAADPELRDMQVGGEMRSGNGTYSVVAAACNKTETSQFLSFGLWIKFNYC